jgi:hypothetical protein
MEHIQATIHLSGDIASLDAITKALVGVDTAAIAAALPTATPLPTSN